MDTKAQIRQIFQQKRDELTIEEHKEYAAAICSHLIQSEMFQEADTIYLYYPLKSEVSLLKLFCEANILGKTIGFPKVTGNQMEFYKINDLSLLQEGCFHVMEPDLKLIDINRDLLQVENPLVLTPGLVFDRIGNRYGYGKGYYDKYFRQYPKAIKIGIAYDLQLIELLEADDFDIPVEHLYTQNGKIF